MNLSYLRKSFLIATFALGVVGYIGIATAQPVTITCVPDQIGKPAIDGCGYDYKDARFEPLSGSQAWAKIVLRLDSLSLTRTAEVGIFGQFISSVEEKHKAQILSVDDKHLSLFYAVSLDDDKGGANRESWLLTYFPRTQTLYFSGHSFDNRMCDLLNSPPEVRGQVFKARCQTGR